MKQQSINKRILSLVSIFLTVSLIIVISGCLDTIEFDRPQTIEDGIAIQGKLVISDPSYIRVTIRKVFDFSSSARLINVRDVVLSDDTGTSISLVSSQDGVFTREFLENDPDMSITFDRSYKIRVETFDNRVYESSLEGIVPVPTPTDLKVGRIQKDGINAVGDIVARDFIAFTIDTPLEASPNSGNTKILWELEGTYRVTDSPESYSTRACRPIRITNETNNKTCYVNISPLSNYVSLDGTNINQSSIEDFTVLETGISNLFSEGYYLTVLQQSLTESAFAYWSQVNQVLSRSGDLFEPPAGKIITNFTNINDPNDDVFGYFYATEEKPIRVSVPPRLADNPSSACPAPPSEGGQAPSDCCDCLTLFDSTLERPVWWIE